MEPAYICMRIGIAAIPRPGNLVFYAAGKFLHFQPNKIRIILILYFRPFPTFVNSKKVFPIGYLCFLGRLGARRGRAVVARAGYRPFSENSPSFGG